MAIRIGVGITMLTMLAIDFFEFHDILEYKTLPEYLTGLVSIPVLLLLAALFTGVLHLTRSES